MIGPIKWWVTDHAAERYASRIAPGMPTSEAAIYLRRALPDATLLEERTFAGHQRWLLANRKAVVVAKVDDGSHVAVTVIGCNELCDTEAADEVLAAFKRATKKASEPLPVQVDAPPAGPPTSAEIRDRWTGDPWREKYRKLAAQYNQLRDAHKVLRDSVEHLGKADAVEVIRALRTQLMVAQGQVNALRGRAKDGAK